MDTRKLADDFLKEAHQFHLGRLPTECPNTRTEDLSTMAKESLPSGINSLKEVDLDALRQITGASSRIEQLHSAIRKVFARGNRVFLCGCGATGRLSLSLEVLWRELMPVAEGDRVIAFMAGGDLALVRSIENFEDHPDYGARQLEELGFKEGDVLVSTTEGGETPFVIGATEHAARLSKEPPWFLYCNPDEVLCETVERSRRVIENPHIEKINMSVGPMGLSGSTRMQASTVLMLGVGIALLNAKQEGIHAEQEILHFAKKINATDYSFLQSFIEAESKIYLQNGFTNYETDVYGITILTDTTERSPTFSLRGFENLNDDKRVPALCYLFMNETESSEQALRKILRRDPRPLEWQGVASIAGAKRLAGFDFSQRGKEERNKLIANAPKETMSITRHLKKIRWRFGDLQHDVDVSELNLLETHLLLKSLLNIHSTLLMGRLGRYEGNLMTWVRPSNKKLIDRAIRYTDTLLQKKENKSVDYKTIAYKVFELMPTLKEDEPIVVRAWQSLKNT